MTPLCGNQIPSICLYQVDDITNLHLTELRTPTSVQQSGEPRKPLENPRELQHRAVRCSGMHGAPSEIRTRVTGLKGRCPRPGLEAFEAKGSGGLNIGFSCPLWSASEPCEPTPDRGTKPGRHNADCSSTRSRSGSALASTTMPPRRRPCHGRRVRTYPRHRRGRPRAHSAASASAPVARRRSTAPAPQQIAVKSTLPVLARLASHMRWEPSFAPDLPTRSEPRGSWDPPPIPLFKTGY
jgi:hypothetical protein